MDGRQAHRSDAAAMPKPGVWHATRSQGRVAERRRGRLASHARKHLALGAPLGQARSRRRPPRPPPAWPPGADEQRADEALPQHGAATKPPKTSSVLRKRDAQARGPVADAVSARGAAPDLRAPARNTKKVIEVDDEGQRESHRGGIAERRDTWRSDAVHRQRHLRAALEGRPGDGAVDRAVDQRAGQRLREAGRLGREAHGRARARCGKAAKRAIGRWQRRDWTSSAIAHFRSVRPKRAESPCAGCFARAAAENARLLTSQLGSETFMKVLDAFGLQGQVAIVTGGGAGIGRGIAELFAQAGAAVVVSDLKKETADAVAAGHRRRGRPRDRRGLRCHQAMRRGRRWSTRRWRPSARSTSWSTTPAAAGPSPSTCRWRPSSGPTSSTSSRCST